MSRELQPLVATAVAGVGSVATLLASVAAMKAFAVIVGPEGVGLYALLQSVINLGLVVTGVGLHASSISLVARADANDGPAAAASTAGTAVLMGVLMGTLGTGVLLLVREPVAELVLGSHEQSRHIALIAPALLTATTASVITGVLVGLRRLRTATVVSVVGAMAVALVTVAAIALWGLDGVAPGLAAAWGLQLVIALVALRWSPAPLGRPREIWATGRRLLALGLPVAGSQAIGMVAMLVVPVVVLQALGTVEVGFYRAAMAVSVGLTALFAVGIHQDFLPRISAAIGPDERKSLVEKRMRIVIGIGLPAILLLLASAPLLIEVLYASEFRPALTILRWQLVGDMIRLPAIVLATAALGVGSRSLYFGIEGLGGFAFVVGAVVAIGALGLEGVGMAYAAAQAMTFAAGWLVMRARLGVVPGRLQVVVVITTVGSCVVVLADLAPAAMISVFLLAGIGAAILAWTRLVPLHRQRAL